MAVEYREYAQKRDSLMGMIDVLRGELADERRRFDTLASLASDVVWSQNPDTQTHPDRARYLADLERFLDAIAGDDD